MKFVDAAYENQSLVCEQNTPVIQPNAGSILIYDCRAFANSNKSLKDIRASFRCDGYRYGKTHGTKAYGSAGNKIKRACRFLFGESEIGCKDFA